MTMIEEFNREAASEARDILDDLKTVAEKEHWEEDLFIEKVINEMRRQQKGDVE